MKKKLRISLILLIAGIIFCAVALSFVGFDFSKLDSSGYTTETFVAETDFLDIRIHANTSDVRFAVSDDLSCKVVSRHKDYMAFTAEIKDSVLVIRETDQRQWYEHIGIHWGDGGVMTVYLPKGTYCNLFAETDTGDITVPKDYTFANAQLSTDTGDIRYYGGLEGDLKAEVDTGDIILKDIHTPGNITLEADTGNLKLHDVICENLKIETDTGDVKLSKCDAGAIDATTDTGDISGSLLTDKIFIVDNSTGKVIIPESTSGGKCKLDTSTGDIKITID